MKRKVSNFFSKKGGADKSKGQLKIENYFKKKIDEHVFQDGVNKLRTKHHIKVSNLKSEAHPPCLCCISDGLQKDIENLLSSIGLHGAEWEEIIYGYILYGKISEWWFNKYAWGSDLCMLTDSETENELKQSCKDGTKLEKKERKKLIDGVGVDVMDMKYFESTSKKTDKQFPIILRISPQASVRDVYDFLRKSNFLELKEKYDDKNEIGKFRHSNTLEMNDFVYKNRHLLHKEIVELVKKKFDPNMDEMYIRNIIFREKKRRS